VALLLERIPRDQLNEARLRMARIPQGAELIANAVSKAPGFSIGNVHVMAGVPSIMQAMLDAVAPRLETGRKMHSRSLPAGLREGDIAASLGAIQADYPDVPIGSYPNFDPATGFTTTIVLRSRDEARLAAAEAAVAAMLAELKTKLASG
jgi:molybdopterin-biosynthesis enzyme MoeA-like protein